jgi:hypothetical protein
MDDSGCKVKILCFWTLAIVLSCLNHRPLYISNHDVSETGLSLRLQVKPTQLGPIDRASLYFRTPVPASRYSIEAQLSRARSIGLGTGTGVRR